LLDVAHEEKAELVVVGSRGRGAVASEVLGSDSRTLAKRATCPLVVVPPNASPVADRSDEDDGAIVFGVDGSHQALAAARVVGELAHHLGYRVVVVHAARDARSLVAYVGRSTTPSLSVQPDAPARRSEPAFCERRARGLRRSP
jgi:nucleotide-binding universal stress UspA family protein